VNRGFLLSIAIVICAAGLVYALIVLYKDGTLQRMWGALTSGGFGGFPL